MGLGTSVALCPIWGRGASPHASLRDVARALTAPTTRRPLVWCGSSRGTYYDFDKALMTAASEVMWSGTTQYGTAAPLAGAHNSILLAKAGGTTATVSPLVGGTQNWFPTACVETQFLGGNANVTIHSSRLLDSLMLQTDYPLLFARMALSTVWARGIWWRHAGGVNCAAEPGVRFYIAETGNAWDTSGSRAAPFVTNTLGAGYGYSDTTIQAAGYAWGADTRMNWSCDPNVPAAPAGQVIAVAPGVMFVDSPGVVLLNWSAGGSGMSRIALPSIHSDDVFDTYLSLHGSDPIFVLEAFAEGMSIGTIRTDMKAAVARFRAANPLATVIIHTGYPHSTSGADPAWQDDVETVAREIGGVHMWHSYRDCPDYATGVGLGYYTDLVHYSSLGRMFFAGAFGAWAGAAS